jgi:hypothetical protein
MNAKQAILLLDGDIQLRFEKTLLPLMKDAGIKTLFVQINKTFYIFKRSVRDTLLSISQ